MKRSILFVFISMFMVRAWSQNDTIRLEDITISVAPFEQRLSETTGSLSIIRPRDNELQHAINISDELNTAPGIFISKGTHTTNRVTIRGVGSRTPYSSNRIRAYIEEIPLTNGDGISTIEDMDISGISRMEILKGPTSALYGSGLGGVILLKALYPTDNGLTYDAGASYGAFNSSKYGASLGYKTGHTSLHAGYAGAVSDGFRENNDYRRDQLYLHAKTGSSKNTFSFHIIATSLNAEIPSSLNLSDYLNSPKSAAGNWLAINGYETYQKITGGASWKHAINDQWQHKIVLFSALQDPYESRPFNILDDASVMAGVRDYIRFEKDNIHLQAGMEFFYESYQWKIFETIDGEQGALQTHNSEIRRYSNVFVHFKWEPVPKLHIETGTNLNLLRYNLRTIYHSDNTDQSGSYSYNPVFSPRIGINYNAVSNQFIHASAGHGFSAPSLEETLLPEGTVNSELLPETGWNIDAGIRGWILGDRWYYDLAGYTIFISNMLVTERITEEIFTGINAGRTRLSGIEIYNRFVLDRVPGKSKWEHTLSSSIFLNNNLFTEFVDDGISYNGKHLPGIPAQVFHARWVTRYKEKLDWMAELRYSGKQYMNDSNSEIYNGHFLSNLRASYTFRIGSMPFGITVSAGVNNIFNTSYASMILVNAPSFGGASPRYYYPGMPRNSFVSLRLKK
ncbi:MAG: TonB-dependent receptor [Bacteroidales bacterium]|nr:TonB-dependent receptor [Bacteroidales bacterium]